MTENEIEELMSKGNFPDGERPEQLIETHISWVILTGRHAYKIKKPVKLTFLDFTTLEKRKYYCYRELFLNRNISEGIYKEVTPIAIDKGRLHVGERYMVPVDYAVKMRKLDNALRMDVLLQEGKVDRPVIRSLARLVHKMHKTFSPVERSITVNEELRQFNDILQVKKTVPEVKSDEELRSYIKHGCDWASATLRSLEPLLMKRNQEGFIRDCHGDLHSCNIFLYDPPVIFDRIEFNDSFRHIDVLSEVAFICMDLEAFDRPDLSTCFIETYLQDEGPLSPSESLLFDYYRCYRANIRAKVHALSANEADSIAKRKSHIADMRRYLRLMHSYTQSTQSTRS